MGKLLAILGICTVVIGSYGATFHMGGEYRETQLQNKTLSGDNAALIQQAQTMVDAFSQTQNALNDLRQTPDSSIAPKSIASTIASLCDRRKASNVPCAPPKPSSGGN